MEQNKFWDLLAKKKVGEATPEEQLELNQYLIENPSMVEVVFQIDALWRGSFPHAGETSNEELAAAWQDIEKKIIMQSPTVVIVDEVSEKVGTRRFVKMWYRIAAAAAVLFAIASGFFLLNNYRGDKQVKQNIVSTKNGSKSKIDLPDGTQVWLNAGSKLMYDEDFGKESRNVELVGEAYFDVVHNKKMPFFIKTRHMNIKVLGTAFNVRAYPGDIITEASLIRGAIEVSFPGRPMEKLLLKPQQKITIVNRDTVLINTVAAKPAEVSPAIQESVIPVISVSTLSYNKTDSAVIETSWLSNKMIFRKKEFGDLSKDIERWFNVTMQFEDSSLIKRKFTGTFHNENILEVLNALQLTYPFRFRFEKDNNTVFIYR
ncbi:MAG: FecR family protein [Ferruginibacter sp.]|nr:FecR family protein [Ferruginibacter sp.]